MGLEGVSVDPNRKMDARAIETLQKVRDFMIDNKRYFVYRIQPITVRKAQPSTPSTARWLELVQTRRNPK